MNEFLDKLTGPNGGAIIGVVSCVGVLATVIATVAVIQWRKFRQARMDAGLARRVLDLKQEMIERGMSADDVERVLSAQPPTGSSASATAPRRPHEMAEYTS